ncbi:hypothetical protein CHUAL_011773 [Chamberlinius hualienensis]
MAAHSVTISRKLQLAKLLTSQSRALSYSPRRNGYYVLLPEVPLDSSENNPIMRIGSTPAFNSLTPEICSNGVGKLIIECEAGLCRIEDSLKKLDADKIGFEDVITPLEKLIAPLDYAWSVVKYKFMLEHTDEMANVYKNLHSRVQTARAQRFHSLHIFNAVKSISSSDSKFDTFQNRIIDKYLLESRLNGLSLTGDTLNHFIKATMNIKEEKQKYRTNVYESTRRFRHQITDYEIVRGFPESLLRAMSTDKNNPTQGPWTVTLDNMVYEEFMKHCVNRDLRLNAWRAYNSRASSLSDKRLYNSIPIEEIRFNRRDQAKLLGFSSYAELSMATKMAGSVETVKSMISSFKVPSKAAMESGLEELQEFAGSRGISHKLELWDIPFWRQKYRKGVLGLDDNELRSYFPFEHVVNRLFKLCHLLFNIQIKDETSSVEIWEPNVKYFTVYDDNGQKLGSFFLDPFTRIGKRYVTSGFDSGINRCDASNIKPMAFLNFNFSPPAESVPSLLTFNDVILLLGKFGSTLQHLLAAAPYNEVSGSNNLEWDAVNVCSHFMSSWLHNENVLKSFSCHFQTNQQLSSTDCANIIKGCQHLSGFDLTKELYLSHFDLECYSRKDFWLDICRTLWSEYLSSELDKYDSHPCSLSTIFSEDYAASYFSFLWAKMIAADIYKAFDEVGIDNEAEIKALGNRLRDTFISLGGGCHPSETFRLFRGRDPSPVALLSVSGISK